MNYGSEATQNRMAEIYTPEMKADRMMGAIPETLRKHPRAKRSIHPILSFAGVNADAILEAQTLDEPLAPIGKLYEARGIVLLVGVGQTVNTSIHYAERLAKRKQFMRWALTEDGVVECPGFPGCSDGFDSLERDLEKVTRCLKIGDAQVKVIPLKELIGTARLALAQKPQALLCYRTECERCNAVRLDSKR
jgi:aminoglycoside 3-N-acetyltransferase